MGGMDQIDLVQYRDRWRTLVNAVTLCRWRLYPPYRPDYFDSGYLTIGLSTPLSRRCSICVMCQSFDSDVTDAYLYRRAQCLRSDNAYGGYSGRERALYVLICCLWGNDWRPATVTPLCDFYEINYVCKLDLPSNSTRGLAFLSWRQQYLIHPLSGNGSM